MRKFIFIAVSLTLLTGNLLYAKSKRYDIASGEVQYTLQSGGSIMGMTTHTEGTKLLYFKDHGNLEIQDVKSTESMMGKTEKEHHMTKFENGKIKIVDFEEEVIIKRDMTEMMKDKDMQTMGKEMLEKMGGKKVGSGKVLGYNCEIWEAMGSKMWFYKGVPLKMEADMMGIKTSEVATKAIFNKKISDDKFTLPNFPEKSMDQLIQQEMMRPDAQGNQPSPQELQQMQEMMKNLGGMLGGQK